MYSYSARVGIRTDPDAHALMNSVNVNVAILSMHMHMHMAIGIAILFVGMYICTCVSANDIDIDIDDDNNDTIVSTALRIRAVSPLSGQVDLDSSTSARAPMESRPRDV